MSDWEASPSWVEPEDISSEQFTSKDGLTNEQLNKIVHNERYLKNIADNPFKNKGEWATATSYVKTDGQIDYVIYDNGLYFCKLSHTSSAEILPTNTIYWDIIITGTAPTIIDNLTSTDPTKALSAKQGKLLNDKFTLTATSYVYGAVLSTGEKTITSIAGKQMLTFTCATSSGWFVTTIPKKFFETLTGTFGIMINGSDADTTRIVRVLYVNDTTINITTVTGFTGVIRLYAY